MFNNAIAHRFSWFTHIGDDMPFITMVKGGVRERQRLQTKVETDSTKGVWYDGMGDAIGFRGYAQTRWCRFRRRPSAHA